MNEVPGADVRSRDRLYWAQSSTDWICSCSARANISFPYFNPCKAATGLR